MYSHLSSLSPIIYLCVCLFVYALDGCVGDQHGPCEKINPWEHDMKEKASGSTFYHFISEYENLMP